MKSLFFLIVPLWAVFAMGQMPEAAIPAGQGVNIHFTSARPGEMQMLADGGFGFVRMDFNWGATERKKGVYDFSAYDRLLDDLSRYGIRAMFIFDYGNALYDDNLAPHTDQGRAAFAKWAAAATKHFAGRGVLWEMWNEPNLMFWKPEPNWDDYAQLTLEVGKAMREAAPDELLLGPASSTIDLPFLESCFKAGVLEYLAAVTVHPYRWTSPETVVEEYRKLRVLIDKYAPAGKHIAIMSGEWGYATNRNGFSVEVQGKFLSRQWLVNLSCDIPLSIWYDWRDDGTDPIDKEHHFGTVGYEYHEGREKVYDIKPAYEAARALTSELRGYRLSKRLVLESPDDWLLLFTKGSDVKLVAWTSSPTAHATVLPTSAGRFLARSHTGEALAPLSADAKGLVVRLSDAPVFLTPETPNEFLTILAGWTRLRTDRLVSALVAFTPDLKVTNTSGRPLKLFTGGQDGIEIKPGEAHATGSTYHMLRSGTPVRLRQELRIEGFPIAYQESMLAVSNPVIITPLPAMGGRIPLRIETPTGEPVAGRLRMESPVTASAEIATAKGNEESIILIPGAPDTPRYTVSVQLTDKNSQSLVEVPSRTYHPLPLALSNYRLVPDGDAKVVSEQTARMVEAPAGLPAPGMQSLQIDYRIDRGWKFIRLAVMSPQVRKLEGEPMALGMWIFGDGSGNRPRVRFVDSTGQCFQSAAPALRYKGWRYAEFSLQAEGADHWGGANDGVIHYPIRLETMLLLLGNATKGTAGTVDIAGPTLVYPAGQP